MKPCPNCQGKELKSVKTPEASVTLDICPNCNGTWFDEDDLGVLVGNLHSVQSKIEQAVRSGTPSDKVSPISGEVMLEIPFRGSIPIYYCQESKGVWVEQSDVRAVLGTR